MPDLQPLLRQWLILRMLSARRLGVSVRELADETGVGHKTVRRDLQLLERVGFQLERIAGERGRIAWKLDAAGGQSLSLFNLTEILSLYLGRRFLEPLAGTYFWDGAQSAFQKIRASLGDQALRYLDKIATAFYQTSVGTADYSQKAEIIDALMVGIEDRKVTSIGYQSMNATEPVTYDVHPLGIVFHKHSLYLIAFAPAHDEVRHYKLDRISTAEVDACSLPFTTRPAGFDLRQHLSGSFGIYQANGRPQRICVRFAPEVARFVAEKSWPPTQRLTPQRDSSLLADFHLGETEEFRKWILSFGANAVVLEPAELVEAMRQEIARMSDFLPAPRPHRCEINRNHNAFRHHRNDATA